MKDDNFIIKKDGELYLSGEAVLTIIIEEAINATELKPHLKCIKILKEISKLMATRRYGSSATEIYKKIIQIIEAEKQKDFAYSIYNKFIYPSDIQYLLTNVEV